MSQASSPFGVHGATSPTPLSPFLQQPQQQQPHPLGGLNSSLLSQQAPSIGLLPRNLGSSDGVGVGGGSQMYGVDDTDGGDVGRELYDIFTVASTSFETEHTPHM
jgi:hypothetical protein